MNIFGRWSYNQRFLWKRVVNDGDKGSRDAEAGHSNESHYLKASGDDSTNQFHNTIARNVKKHRAGYKNNIPIYLY